MKKRVSMSRAEEFKVLMLLNGLDTGKMTCQQFMAEVKEKLGTDLSESSANRFCRDAGKPRFKKPPTPAGNGGGAAAKLRKQVLTLAATVKDLYEMLGTDVPEPLLEILQGVDEGRVENE